MAKVIKTVSWADSGIYKEAWNTEEMDFEKRDAVYTEVTECVKRWVRKNAIRLDGSQYQHWEYAPDQKKPLIEVLDGDWRIETVHIPIVRRDDGKEYAFRGSQRYWGGLMYEVWGNGSKDFNDGSENDPMGYCHWAWDNPDERSLEKCESCRKYYFNNMHSSKGLLPIHDHSDDPEKNCRGIPVGHPKKRNVWQCDRFEEQHEAAM
ncbi:MAG: hypothetical protein LBK73_08445 [Treponema sp.]|jgi:hypothetical protein|nr:hypothetical protein [Treponema sp.]